jgi:hypothetical protein
VLAHSDGKKDQRWINRSHRARDRIGNLALDLGNVTERAVATT